MKYVYTFELRDDANVDVAKVDSLLKKHSTKVVTKDLFNCYDNLGRGYEHYGEEYRVETFNNNLRQLLHFTPVTKQIVTARKRQPLRLQYKKWRKHQSCHAAEFAKYGFVIPF